MNLFDNIDYLKNGDESQQQALSVLKDNRILEKLHGFTPVLAGTIPLNINIDNSDLDILCYWDNQQYFINALRDNFEKYDSFTLQQVVINNIETVLVNFWCDGFEVEVFGQNIPVKEQMGYLHMIAEYGILKHFGKDFRQQIIGLKKEGYKTEPAFAKLLNLEGNPYIALLEYKLNPH